VLRNSFTDRWAATKPNCEPRPSFAPAYLDAMAAGDADRIAVYVGEAIGIMDTLVPAGDSIRAMVAQRRRCSRATPSKWRNELRLGSTGTGSRYPATPR